MGKGSQLAFSHRTSDFQEWITDVKWEMAALVFCKSAASFLMQKQMKMCY